MSYLFYAIECSGGSFPFDQVIRFAGIRTDESFREQDRYLIPIRLRPDVVPSARYLVEQDRSLEAIRTGETEVRAIRHIHALLNESGTVSVGFNSLRFEDEMLRFSFFRNLLTPYTHQWENGCGRMDLLPMTAVYWLRESEAVEWPAGSEERPLTLEALDRTNDWTDDSEPWNAIRRVKAMLHLARELARDGDGWTELREQFDKNIDRDRLSQLPAVEIGSERYPLALLIDGRFGPARRYHRPALCVGMHRHYRNRSLWLTLDSAELRGARRESVARHTEVIARKFGVPTFLFPPDDDRLAGRDPQALSMARRNTQWLREHPDVLHEIAGHYLEKTHAETPSADVDAALYRFGFMSDRDRRIADRFHEADDPAEKMEIAGRFDASELRELAVRVIMRNSSPEEWPPQVRRYVQWYGGRVAPVHYADVLVDHRGVRRRTPDRARKQIRAIRAEPDLSGEAERRLDELAEYLAEGLPLTRATRQITD